MKIKQIKTVDNLVDYYLSNESRESLQFLWDYNLGIVYNTDKDFEELRQSEQINEDNYHKLAFDSIYCEDYHRRYFKLRLLYEVRSHNRIYPKKDSPYGIDDVQTFVSEFGMEEVMFLDGETYDSEKDLMLYLNRWYSKGLQMLGAVKKMVEKNVSKEVFLHYLLEWDLDFVEEWHTPQEEYEAINLQKELLWLAYLICTEEYSSHRVWLHKHISSFKNPLADKAKPTPVIHSMKWVSKTPIEQALKSLQPYAYLIKDSSLEGLKMAFGGGNIYEIRGCIVPSPKNTEKLLFLIYHLIKSRCVEESESMEETIQVLMDSSTSYRRYKSNFVKEQFSVPYDMEQSMLTLINTFNS